MSTTVATTTNTVSVNVSDQIEITGQNGAKSSNSPALAVYDNQLYMAYLGAGGSSLYSCSFDGSTWHPQINIADQNGAKSTTSPALASFNGKLYMAYRGSNSNNLYICSFDGSEWGGQTKITSQNDAQTGSSPALASLNGRLYMAYRGSGASTSLYVCSSSDGITWGSQTNVSNINGAQTTPNAGPALATYNNNLYMGYEGVSGSIVTGADLYVCSSSNGTSWTSQTDVADSNGAQCIYGVSLASSGGLLFAIYHSTSSSQLKGCAFNNGTWSSNQVNFYDSNGACSSGVPALAFFQNQLYTAYVGTMVSTSLWEFPFTATWNG